MPLRKLAVYLAYQTDCQPCSLREQCLAKGGQRGSSPSRECGPSSLASTRTGAGFAQAGPARTDPVGGCGWASPSPHLDEPLAQAIRRDPSACRHAAEPFPSPSPTSCGAIASSLKLARSARMQCLVWTTTMAHHRSLRSHFSGNELIKEEQTNGGVF